MRIGNLITDRKVAVIQARMASNRFPGKVLSYIDGRPALDILVERLKRSKHIDDIVVVTTKNKEDDMLSDFCDCLGVYVYRDNNDVLEKVCRAADKYKADIIIDVTGDCPFIDAREIDKLIWKLYLFKCAYVSNIWPRSLPIGFDIQVYKTTTLQFINSVVTDKVHRTHSGWNVLFYGDRLYRDTIKMHHNRVREKYNYPDWRVVLDYPEDLLLLNKIYNHFGHGRFSQWDIIRLLKKNLDWLEINKECRQKTPDEI